MTFFLGSFQYDKLFSLNYLILWLLYWLEINFCKDAKYLSLMLTELSSAFQERPNGGPLYLQQSIEQRLLYATLY